MKYSYDINYECTGKFYEKSKETAPLRGDRAPMKKPEDNLYPEGEFYKPVKSPVPKGERADVKRPEDNLHPEGILRRTLLSNFLFHYFTVKIISRDSNSFRNFPISILFQVFTDI